MEPAVKFASPDDEYLLRIYFHRIRRSNGSDGLTGSQIQQVYGTLNTDYDTHGISFFWDCTIDNIDSDYMYDNISSGIFTINNHQDGIDVYLSGTNSNTSAGQANGVGTSSEFFVSGSYWGSPSVSLPVSSSAGVYVAELTQEGKVIASSKIVVKH